MSDCKPGWESALFQKAVRTNVKSTFKGPKDSSGSNTVDVPEWFEDINASGRSDFIVWANLPQITYSAEPDSLYNMSKLQKEMESNECFVKETVKEQSKIGVKYPTAFYAGLAMAGAAVLYSVFKVR